MFCICLLRNFPLFDCDDAKIVLSLIYMGALFHTCGLTLNVGPHRDIIKCLFSRKLRLAHASTLKWPVGHRIYSDITSIHEVGYSSSISSFCLALLQKVNFKTCV